MAPRRDDNDDDTSMTPQGRPGFAALAIKIKFTRLGIFFSRLTGQVTCVQRRQLRDFCWNDITSQK